MKLIALKIFTYFYRFQTIKIIEKYLKGTKLSKSLNIKLFGYKFPINHFRSNTHCLLFMEQENFIKERYILFNLINDTDQIIDVGSNIGYYLLLFHRIVGKKSKIICIEPDPKNYLELENLNKINKLNNVILLNVAAGKNNEELFLKPGLNAQISYSSLDLKISVIKLDNFIKLKPSFLKIDVEGYEGQVLEGSIRIIKNLRPKIFIEIHPHLLTYGYTTLDIINFLKKYYNDLLYLDRIKNNTLIDKLKSRYLLNNHILEINNEVKLLDDINKGLRKTPFWVICRKTL